MTGDSSTLLLTTSPSRFLYISTSSWSRFSIASTILITFLSTSSSLLLSSPLTRVRNLSSIIMSLPMTHSLREENCCSLALLSRIIPPIIPRKSPEAVSFYGSEWTTATWSIFCRFSIGGSSTCSSPGWDSPSSYSSPAPLLFFPSILVCYSSMTSLISG